MLNSRDIQKIKFVSGSNITFHLVRRHATITLDDVYRWNFQIRKNILLHTVQRHHRNKNNAEHCREHGYWSFHCSSDNPHNSLLPPTSSVTFCNIYKLHEGPEITLHIRKRKNRSPDFNLSHCVLHLRFDKSFLGFSK